MSGCAVCVYDLYEEAMGRYREEVAGVRERLRRMGVGEDEWPVCARQTAAADAFSELERQLAAKRAAAPARTGL